jgi:hypothetical protein
MEIEAIEKIFARLEELVIDLPQDPLELGPDYLREQISICRGYLNETSQYLQRILGERSLLTMKLEAKEAEYQIKADELLTQDPRVKVLPSLTDRQAMISNILLTDKREIVSLRLELQGSGHVEKVVRLRHKELDNTMSAIRLQRSLLKDQLRTGSFYGDESPEGRGVDELGQMSGEELDAYLSAVDKEEVDDTTEDLVTDVEGEEEPVEGEEEPAEVVIETAEEESEVEDPEEPAEEESPAEEDDELDAFGDLDDEDGDVSLQDEVDALVEEGGTDATPPAEPPKKRRGKGKKEGSVLKVEAKPPISEKDVDTDMDDFLDGDFEDDLDSILEDV